jgi:RNA polymerase sigma factor (sigma-70 family)
MTPSQSTCWTIIEGAAAGRAEDREEFARRYGPVVRAYLAARWRPASDTHALDDTVQEVFVECFKQGGVLDRAERDRGGGFRAFLFGVVRNVALRAEAKRARQRKHAAVDLDRVPGDESSLSRVFDRAWAKALMREAAQKQRAEAERSGEAALRRVELLRLRFHGGLPIRDIAGRWGVEAALLHHEYARAREEFRQILLQLVAFHHPGPREEVERECMDLLALLG